VSRNTFPVDPAIYTPSPWGMMYHNLKVDEALGAGAAGPGKSLCLTMDPFLQIAVENERCANPEHPHHIKWGQSAGWALHIRRTEPRLLQTLARADILFKAIEPRVKFHQKHLLYTFPSGYRYQFGHVRNPGDWHSYDSQQYTHIAFDELVEILEEQYDLITSRKRVSDPVLRLMFKIRSMSNPVIANNLDSGIRTDPLWVRRRFVDPFPAGRKILTSVKRNKDGELIKRTKIYLPATLYDNPDKQFVKDYEAELLFKPQYIVRSRLYGDWYVTAGSFYSDAWNPSIHVIEPFNLPRDYRLFRAMDWGHKTPGCVHWYALDHDGNMYQVYELTFVLKLDVEVADKIKDIERKMGFVKNGRSLLTGPADTQLWEERGDRSYSKAAAMAKRGVAWVPANKKSSKRNAELFMARLTDHSRDGRLPGYMVFNTCQKTIMTIPSIRTDPDDIDKPAHGGEDHWHDNVLYACAYASKGNVGLSLSEAQGIGREEDDGKKNDDSYGYGYLE